MKRFINGEASDPQNLYKRCDRQDFPDPQSLSLDDVEIELFICHQNIDKLKYCAPKLRVEHLRACLKKSKDKKQEEQIKHIERILKEESNKSRWRQVNRSTGN